MQPVNIVFHDSFHSGVEVKCISKWGQALYLRGVCFMRWLQSSIVTSSVLESGLLWVFSSLTHDAGQHKGLVKLLVCSLSQDRKV